MELDKALAVVLISCIRSHTSVNLQKTRSQTPEEISEKRKLQFASVKECILEIKMHFASLGVIEIKDAFSMLSAGKIVADVETYGGEFEPVHLGRVLCAYVKFRKNVIFEYEKKNDWKIQQQENENKNELNESARNRVELEYSALLRHYQETGDLETLDSEVSAYWGKILVISGIIELTDEQRSEIIIEAKTFVKNQIGAERVDLTKKSTERRTAVSMLEAIEKGERNAAFNARWHIRYAELVVIKSILNHE